MQKKIFSLAFFNVLYVIPSPPFSILYYKNHPPRQGLKYKHAKAVSATDGGQNSAEIKYIQDNRLINTEKQPEPAARQAPVNAGISISKATSSPLSPRPALACKHGDISDTVEYCAGTVSIVLERLSRRDAREHEHGRHTALHARNNVGIHSVTYHYRLRRVTAEQLEPVRIMSGFGFPQKYA